MRVKEWRGSVVFLHEVAEGAAGRSWGVHVAELAGVPKPVVRRAAALLSALEKQSGPLAVGGALGALPLFAAAAPPDIDVAGAAPDDDLRRAFAEIDPDRLTPREALDALYRLRALLPAALLPAALLPADAGDQE
jgi:DNA mismatch repair protein MutS